MDPQYANKKLADVSEEELVRLGFLGQGVPPGIQLLIKKARANPDSLGSITCFAADCLTRVYHKTTTAPDPARLLASPTSPTSPTSPMSPTSPTSPTLSDTETLCGTRSGRAAL
ncbi:hypothetical protein C8Q78DRAFT_1080188 [Trametes maxima]|nr:hypothetical protein C8Q78DRAFT_1080188 [Trametes maxima]